MSDLSPFRQETDIALAAALAMEGHEILDVAVLTDKKTQAAFVFKETPKLKRDRERFHKGQLQVAPNDFVLEMKKLKTRAYSEIRNVGKTEQELFPSGGIEE